MRAGRTFADAVRFAWTGLVESARRGRNMRAHLALGILAGAFAAHAPLGPAERGLIVLCIALVVSAESLDTAVESAVDLASPGPDERARVAKDAAAGAVLALAAGSVLAFAAVAAPVWSALVARARSLALPAAGAAVAALAAAILAAPSGRGRRADLALALAGLAGLIAVARRAEGHAGIAAAALCFAVALDAGLRRPRAR
ncbi:MAG TPA: diacylglycerol kinase family protein [Anaeromyxobacteraceae bacterium]|nr:diacylglycerol kinase family protein [Anaeromyxobacteraceae bacterium]